MDKGSAFLSHVIKEMAGVLGNTNARQNKARANNWYAWTISRINQTKVGDWNRRAQIFWDKYLGITVLIYNTIYHASFGCEPRRVFLGRIPYNSLDLKLGTRPEEIPTLNSYPFLKRQKWYINMSERMPSKLTWCTGRTMTKKQMPQGWRRKNMCMSYGLKQNTREANFPLTEFRRIGPHNIEKVLPNNKYLVPKTGTDRALVLHSTRPFHTLRTHTLRE